MELIGYDSDYYNQQYDSFPLPPKKSRTKSKKGFCCYCSKELNKHNYTRDHIYPKSLGGKITKPCCKTCNTEKSNMTLIQYAQFIGKRMSEMDKQGDRNTLGFRLCAHKMKNIEDLMNLKAEQR